MHACLKTRENCKFIQKIWANKTLAKFLCIVVVTYRNLAIIKGIFWFDSLAACTEPAMISWNRISEKLHMGSQIVTRLVAWHLGHEVEATVRFLKQTELKSRGGGTGVPGPPLFFWERWSPTFKFEFCSNRFKPGAGKWRPAGQMWPATAF